jgi:hypothetical protein
VTKIKTLFVVLLLSLPLFGQYVNTLTAGWTDNTPNCTSINCLTPISGIVAEIKAGADGTIWGLTSGKVLWKHPASNGGWTQLASGLQTAGGASIVHISVGSAKHILALTSASSNNVYTLNSAGNGWTVLPGNGHCTTDAEIGVDGDIWCLVGTQIFHFSGSVWNGIAGGLSVIAVGSAQQVWGVNSSGSLYTWAGTAWTTVATPGFTPAHSLNALGVGSDIGPALAIMDVSGTVHFSPYGGAGPWYTISGLVSSLGMGGGAYLFEVNSAGTPYHVNTLIPNVANAVSGNGLGFCPVDPQGCPPGSYHTATIVAAFGGRGGKHGTAGVTAQDSGPPVHNMNAVAKEDGWNCDPLFGDDSGGDCDIYPTGLATCVIMGRLQSFDSVAKIFDAVGPATTGGTYIPGSAYLDLNGPGGRPEVKCGTSNSCTPATTPPRCNIPDIYVVPDVGESPDQECSLQGGWLFTQPSYRILNHWWCEANITGNYTPWMYQIIILGPNSSFLPYACTV